MPGSRAAARPCTALPCPPARAAARHCTALPCPVPLPRRPPAGQRQVRRPRHHPLYLSGGSTSLLPPGSCHRVACSPPSIHPAARPSPTYPQPCSAVPCPPPALPPPRPPHRPTPHRPLTDSGRGAVLTTGRPAPWPRARHRLVYGASCRRPGRAACSSRSWQSGAGSAGEAWVPPQPQKARLGQGAMVRGTCALVPLCGFFSSFFLPSPLIDIICYVGGKYPEQNSHLCSPVPGM